MSASSMKLPLPGKRAGRASKSDPRNGRVAAYDNVRLASEIAMRAGADFIKTSTGKISPAATMPVTLVMLEAIRDYFYETGIRSG